jgi:glutathione S-transferase
MNWEQYNHEPNVATLRFWFAFLGEDQLSDLQRAMLPGKIAAAEAALALMDQHLSQRGWFVGEAMTLADIALYAYTHVAEDGRLRLADYPNVQAWLARVAAQPGHIAITD